MKPGVPWSVKGIEPDAREAAKNAARRSGMTLGEWLNSKIIETADDASDARPEFEAPSARAGSNNQLERTASRLEDIAEQLSRISRRDTETAQRAVAQVEQRDSETFHKILSRVESNERQTVEAFTAVNDRLSNLGRQMTLATRRGPEDSQSLAQLEKAMRNIVEHVETSEKRTRDNFKSLHDRMASLSQKAASAPQDAVAKQAPAFSQIESRLADLAQRVERSENRPTPNALPDLLKTELTELANRIDSVRDTAEQLASRAQTQAVQASHQELRAIENRIVGLIKEAQASLSGNGAGPAEMQRLRSEVERLNNRINDAVKAQSNNSDVTQLRAAVEQLSTRVAQGPDMRPLADMDRRILDITQRLEQTQAQTRNNPQMSELERRMADLDHKLNDAVMNRGSVGAEEIEERLNDIASRVGRTEQQLGSLETIERAVNQLFDSIEQQRNWTQDVAEQAATRMAQQIMAQPAQQVSLADAPEIMALQQGLQAVRTASEASEGRNQETLEAVHETLEQIVTKLAELETATIGKRVAAAASDPATAAPPAAMSPSLVEANIWPETPTPEPLWTPPPSQPEISAGNPFETLADPVPVMEMAQPQPTVSNPFEQPSASPFSTEPAPQDAAASSDDFIAAARRAAQAAVQPKSVLSGLSPGAARASEEASKKLSRMSFFKPRKREKPAVNTLVGEIKPPPGFKAPANNNEGKKRKYIIMGVFLLVAAGAFTFNLLGQMKKAQAPADPVPIEQQIPEPKPEATAPEGSSAQPPQPKPAELESMLLEQGADPVLTGSVAQPVPDNLAGIVNAGPTNEDGVAPTEAGSLQLREAAALGNVDAQFVIATRYLNGQDGVPQDEAKAAYWFGKAAAAGSAPAQYRLGTLYERGKGVARDMKAALGWYERSAALGNIKAMHNAAVLAAGNGLDKPDYTRAFKWFSLGASHGLKDSQFNLAVLLERGLGTKANPKEALFWYSVAAKQKDADANKRASALALKLKPGDLQETEKRLKLWKPETAPEKANTVAITDPNWKASVPDAG